MPEKPTWQQVADLAAQVDGAQPGMKGICLRGQPGWGQVFAPLTTVVNTFGGTWFDEDWTAGVNAPEFKEATQFYVDLVREHGENGAPQAGLHRVPEQHDPGQRGDVVRRHLGRRLAGGGRLAGQGQDRLRARAGGQDARRPAGCTPGPGASRRPARSRTTRGSSSPGPPARSTRSWSASSWAGRSVPAGKRTSTYENPEYCSRRRPSPSRPRPRSRPPTRRTRACSRGRRPGIQFVGHPRVPRPGHPGLPGRQLRDRRADHRRRGAGQGPAAGGTTVTSKYKK